MEVDEINLEEVEGIEIGAVGIRVTWKDGSRKFIEEGEVAQRLVERWGERKKRVETER